MLKKRKKDICLPLNDIRPASNNLMQQLLRRRYYPTHGQKPLIEYLSVRRQNIVHRRRSIVYHLADSHSKSHLISINMCIFYFTFFLYLRAHVKYSC